jgi:hypothetical protein
VFQDRVGFGGQFPWTQPPAGRDVTYDIADYPAATAMFESSLVICDARHPIFVQPLELMEHYVEAIRRLLADPERVLAAGEPSPVPV